MDAQPPPVPLRVLVVEDREEDAELNVRHIRKHGFIVTWTRVQREADFLAALAGSPDLILLDASLPQFNAMRALTLLRERNLDIPAIVISGSIGEEEAVALMRGGAADYLMKDRLGRIGQAVTQVLAQRRLREEHRRAHQDLITLNAELEDRIQARTAELATMNDALERELAERRHIELLLRQHEASLEQHVALRTAQLARSQTRLRQLASQLMLAEHHERKRLAGDLHDYLAQLLVVTKLNLSQVQRTLGPAGAGALLKDMDSHIDEALTYTRTLVSQLSPSVLTRQGLIPALHWLADQMRTHRLTVRVDSDLETVALSEDHAILLFQSIRELLFNVIKHARTNEASIQVACRAPNTLVISVRDHGVGFDMGLVGESGSRFGLFSIQERMEGMQGSCAFHSAPGRGTSVTLSLPIQPVEANRDSVDSRESTVRVTDPLPPTHKPRAVVADDHHIMRREVVDHLVRQGMVEVVGEAVDGIQALELARTLQPDLIVMDIDMPRMNGIEATTRIASDHPSIAIVGLSVHGDEAMHERMTSAGARASLRKDRLHLDLDDAIRETLQLA